jgi:hypothetical protein
VTFEGPAEEILRAAQTLRGGGNRTVTITIENSRGGPIPAFYSLPPIREGQIQRALETLDTLGRQTIVNRETEERLDMLVRDFGRFTSG